MSKWIFKRHLDDAFVALLKSNAKNRDNWWSEIVRDRDVIIALRGDYLNVYYHGQSIFKVWMNGSQLAASTHPKYLVDPKLSRQVPFDGERFDLGNVADSALLDQWAVGALDRLKRTAKLYSGVEKKGCHLSVVNSNRLLDVEIAFSRNPKEIEDDERQIPRIDIALLEPGDDGFHVRFWEAKAFGNPELGSVTKNGAPRPVVDQISQYRDIIRRHQSELRESYASVCRNLVEIYEGTERFPSGTPINEIARDPSRLSFVTPDVKLFLFGFDAAQKAGAAAMFDDLRKSPEISGVRYIGNPAKAFSN